MKQKLVEKTLQKIAEEGLAKTPEGVGIWIVALDGFPHMKVPMKPLRDPLESKNQQELLTVLKDSGRDVLSGNDVPARKLKQSNWTAQLHFVWDVILAHFVRLAESGKGDAAHNFKPFWTRVVDGKPRKPSGC
jgi:DNA polymerase phi